MSREQDLIQQEFGRAARSFARRTIGRFDHMPVVQFSRVARDETVVEVGVGTGNFLGLFARHAARLVGIDLTSEMLTEARTGHPEVALVAGDGRSIPLRSSSIDLMTSAQMLHHVSEPLPILIEMRRVTRLEGRVLIVDQVATENLGEAMAMNELDLLRDPSHAMCRPPSAFRILVLAAGLEIEDERVVESHERLSSWMTPEEFAEERIEAVRAFIATRGGETGMEWTRDGDDWTYTRRRLMLLARRAR